MRKIVQITSCAGACHEPGTGNNYQSELFALCDDGTLWCLDGTWGTWGTWTRCKDIPQEPESPPAATMKEQPLATFKEGDIVEGNFRGSGHFYPGKVTSMSTDGRYHIAYDDGDTEYTTADRLRRPLAHVDHGK